MKHTIIALAALFTAATVYAQGTVNFQTRVSGSFDGPVRYAGYSTDPAAPLATAGADSQLWGQLYAGPVGGALAAIGAPVEFRSDAGRGYITSGGAVAIPGVAGGSAAQVKLVAWHKSLGNDYAAAVAANMGGVGESTVINIAATGNPSAVPPTTAANLVGLTGFQVSAVIPEPSIAALGLLGAGLLLIRRKK
jgi:hypothetical protein